MINFDTRDRVFSSQTMLWWNLSLPIGLPTEFQLPDLVLSAPTGLWGAGFRLKRSPDGLAVITGTFRDGLEPPTGFLELTEHFGKLLGSRPSSKPPDRVADRVAEVKSHQNREKN